MPDEPQKEIPQEPQAPDLSKPAPPLFDTFTKGRLNKSRDIADEVAEEMGDKGLIKLEEEKTTEEIQGGMNIELMRKLDSIIPGGDREGSIWLEQPGGRDAGGPFVRCDLYREIAKDGTKTIIVCPHKDGDDKDFGKILYETSVGILPALFIDEEGNARCTEVRYVLDESGNAKKELEVGVVNYPDIDKSVLPRISFISPKVLNEIIIDDMNQYEYALVRSYTTLYEQGQFKVTYSSPS